MQCFLSLCLLSLINKQLSNSVIREFTTFGPKWGESQATQTPGGTISYSFAADNFDNQFVDLEIIIFWDNPHSGITKFPTTESLDDY